MVAGGAVVSAALTATALSVTPKREPTPSDDPIAVRDEASAPETRMLPVRDAVQSGGEGGTDKVEQVRAELQLLKEQRSELQEELKTVEKELRKREEPPAYEYDLTQEQWKELAAIGRVKYRTPCQMSADSGWSIGTPILDELGLGPDDEGTLMDAFRRSNERVWATVKPMCVELVGQEAVVESMGFEGCRPLIDQAQQKTYPFAKAEAQRLVAEVRAGMRAPLREDELPSNLYKLYMALTGEGALFEADLAESFGPEMAKRIWHSFPCANTMRF
jgi:hypothetical protein